MGTYQNQPVVCNIDKYTIVHVSILLLRYYFLQLLQLGYSGITVNI